MEHTEYTMDEDISTTMMRRASGNGADVNIVPAALSCSQGENEETQKEISLNIAAIRTLFRL